LITGSSLCFSNHVAIIVTLTSSSYEGSRVIHRTKLTFSSKISSITFAASCTSIGVRSSHHVTAKIILFAPSRFVSNNGFSIACLAASTALFSHFPYPIHNSAFQESFITILISAKSILISPGFTNKSVIHPTQRYNILSIIVNACLNVVFLSAIVKILSFGTTINVSTASFIFLIHSSAFVVLFFHSKLNGLVTIQTVSIPIHFAISATTGAAHVHVPPHIHAVINTISVFCNICLISS